MSLVPSMKTFDILTLLILFVLYLVSESEQ